jgi:hypothetical protein
MKTQTRFEDRLLNRKLGAFEVLLAALVFELFFGAAWRFWLLLVLCTVFFFAKREFDGEFSLLDVLGLFTDDTETPKKGES